MEWGTQQEQAISAVKAWLDDPHGKQVFRLFGSAGTGKTTLAMHIGDNVDGHVIYAAYTGKAALVMRKKGCHDACTLHSLIYRPSQDEITGKMRFSWNADSEAWFASLIIVDEVSMVDEVMGQDLLRYGVRILVLGDPDQLPPVSGEGYFINAAPDFLLTDIHRQARDNPIIRLSIDVREGRPLKVGKYGTSTVLLRGSIGVEELRAKVLQADQVLCGINRTRAALNRRIRELKGSVGQPEVWVPTDGEKLVCLRNNREKNLMNGGMWEVVGTPKKMNKSISLRVKSLDEGWMSPVDVSVLHEFFQGTDKDLDWRVKKGWDEFTYGYALSVHKSQGSQWGDVLVYDESDVFREDARRHRYTAITRAAETVTVLI